MLYDHDSSRPMNSSNSINRWHAFSLHLAISFIIFAALAAAIALWIFPHGLFYAAGGWEGLRLIAAIDLVLGPLLTLVIINSRKPKAQARRDLAVIGTLQLAALIGGCYIVVQARPLFAVYALDTFYVLNRENYRQAGIDQHMVDSYSAWSPKFFYIPIQNKIEFMSLHAQATLNGAPLPQYRIDLYKELPSEPRTVENLINHELPRSKDPCIRIKVESAYAQGSICFDASRQVLKNFTPREDAAQY